MEIEAGDQPPEVDLLHRDSGYSSNRQLESNEHLQRHRNPGLAEIITTPSQEVLSSTRAEESTLPQVETTWLHAGQFLGVEKLNNRLINDLDKLAEGRSNVLLVRDRAIYEWDYSHSQRNFVQESHDDFARHLRAIAGRLPSDPSVIKLQELHQQISSDYAAFQQQASKVHEVERELREAEMALQRREESISKTGRKLVQKMKQLGLSSPDEHFLAESPPDSPAGQAPATFSTSPELHPAVATYYDKIANVRIMRDRLSQVLAEHHEERAQRFRLQEQEETPEIADEQFYASFKWDIAQAQRSIEDAMEAANVAKSRCEEAGVASLIDESLVREAMLDYNHTPTSIANIPLDSSPPTPLILAQQQGLHGFPQIDERTQRTQLEPPPPEDRVSRWIQEIQPGFPHEFPDGLGRRQSLDMVLFNPWTKPEWTPSDPWVFVAKPPLPVGLRSKRPKESLRSCSDSDLADLKKERFPRGNNARAQLQTGAPLEQQP